MADALVFREKKSKGIRGGRMRDYIFFKGDTSETTFFVKFLRQMSLPLNLLGTHQVGMITVRIYPGARAAFDAFGYKSPCIMELQRLRPDALVDTMTVGLIGFSKSGLNV